METTNLPPQLMAVTRSAVESTGGSTDAQLIKGRSESSESLKEVAQEFEALMMEQVFKSMRKANESLSEDGLFNSREQQFWTEWQDSQMAMEMARMQGLGLAEQLVRQVNQIQGESVAENPAGG